MSHKFTENAAKCCSRAISLFLKSQGGRSPSFEVFKLDMYGIISTSEMRPNTSYKTTEKYLFLCYICIPMDVSAKLV